MKSESALEIEKGGRFAFGNNWRNYLQTIDQERLNIAVESLKEMLNVETLDEKSFLDIGSGSGLFSLAAVTLGAKVVSFDFDKESVDCTRTLKEKYFPDNFDWQISEGSVLDQDFMNSLGQHDVVYSWGVLHHTGAMHSAFKNTAKLVKPGGKLFIAIYNDQGGASRRWLKAKKLYNASPKGLRWTLVVYAFFKCWSLALLKDFFSGRPFHTWKNFTDDKSRGMSPWNDLVDWIGGLPFEVAKPEEVFHYFTDRGYVLDELVTCGGGLGCNQYVFTKKL